MTYNPKANVIDLTQIAGNLLTYIEENQDGALAYFGKPELQGFQKFYTNASGRLQTIFPSLMVLTQSSETDLSGDALIAGLQLTLEGTVSGPDPDELVENTKFYSTALESMLVNIGSTELMANSKNLHRSYVSELETRLDVLRPNTSGFLQIFQTRVTYIIQESGY